MIVCLGAPKQVVGGECVGLSPGSVGESGDLDRVVAENTPAAPGSGVFETSESGSSVLSVLTLHAVTLKPERRLSMRMDSTSTSALARSPMLRSGGIG